MSVLRTVPARVKQSTISQQREKDEASYYAMRIRAHWGIENKLHWHLDVTFREDMCRVRAKNGAVNFSAMRKYALEMLKSRTINSALNEDAKMYVEH